MMSELQSDSISTTIAEAVNRLRPEFGVRDALRIALLEQFRANDSYFRTIPQDINDIIMSLLPDLRVRDVSLILQQADQICTDFTNKYVGTSGEFDRSALNRDYPDLHLQKNDRIIVKIIDGKLYVDRDTNKHNRWVGCGFLRYHAPRCDFYEVYDISNQLIQVYDDSTDYYCKAVLPCGLVYVIASGYLSCGCIMDFPNKKTVQITNNPNPDQIIMNDFGEFVEPIDLSARWSTLSPNVDTFRV